MKYTNLFEEFTSSLNENNGIPDNIMSLVKKIKLTDKFLDKAPNDYMEHQDALENGYKFDSKEAFTLLDKKLQGVTLPKHADDIRQNVSQRYYDVNDYIKINITNYEYSTTIEVYDKLKNKALKRVSVSGVAEKIAEVLAKFLIENASIFIQIANTEDAPGEIPLSIKNLYNDKHAMQIKKAALHYGVTPRDNSPAHAILLSALERNNEPQDRINSIKNVIDMLTQYLNDDMYMNAAQFDNTNPQYHQFPGSSIRTRIR